MKNALRFEPDGPRRQKCEIKSWSDFVAVVHAWDGFRNWAFRGQAEADWSLSSSLSRHIEVSGVCRKAWPNQESRIRRIFERKCHLHVTDPPKDELEWLALMQHHGSPTRLLDFTWSPYVAAFFALERATKPAAVWAINLPLLWKSRAPGDILPGAVDPRDRETFEKRYLPNRYVFIWQGDPYRMPQRVIAQSGTFVVSGDLGLSVEDILARYDGYGPLLLKFVLDTKSVRGDAMASLYSMNITHATLFPGLDGLARSMSYEFEYSWQVDPTTNLPREAIKNPAALPPGVLVKPERATPTRRNR